MSAQVTEKLSNTCNVINDNLRHIWLQSLCIDSNSDFDSAVFHDLADDFVLLCVI